MPPQFNLDEIQQKLIYYSKILGGLYCTSLLMCVAYLTITVVLMPKSNQCIFVTGSNFCYISLAINIIFAIIFAAGFFLWLMFCLAHPKRAQLVPIIRHECRVPIIVFGQVGLSIAAILAWFILPSIAISQMKYIDPKGAPKGIDDMEEYAKQYVFPYSLVGYVVAICSIGTLVVLCFVFKAYLALPWPLAKVADDEPEEEMRFQELQDKHEVAENSEKYKLKNADNDS